MTYLNWDTKVITDFSPENIAKMYDAGYVFTRVDKGVMNKTRSFRVNLKAYAPSSENRRILRKVEDLTLSVEPIPYAKYDWKIGKFAKDFYEKFGDHVFSANKTKELLTDAEKSNYNRLFVYKDARTGEALGYVICYVSDKILHYSFPFYVDTPSRGIGMMTKAIEWAKNQGLDYAYLGSLSRPTDTYKFQFLGSEWFDGKHWQVNTESLREILRDMV